jgi:amino acid adenylation domain-containing protein
MNGRTALAAPAAAATLVGVLSAHARTRPGRRLYTWLDDAGRETAHRTFAEMDGRARAVAARLRACAAPGDRALLLFPPGLEFAEAFLGCLYAGVTAVPAPPPGSGRRVERLRPLVADALPRLVLAPEAVVEGASRRRLAELAGLAAAVWITPPADAPRATEAEQAAEAQEAAEEEAEEPAPSSLAFLQYTSGSTAAPKGVEVSHANLLFMERLLARTFGQGEGSVIVGWLPPYHDMGLIGSLLQPLYLGVHCILLSPAAFLRRPRLWLEAISRYRATTSGGPNFAFDLCVERVPEGERAGLDLASWTVAFNGAEPVSAATLDRFAHAFAAQGFRRASFQPCYGLAEATLLVAGDRGPEGPATARLDAAALEEGRVVEAAGERARTLVGCGRVPPGVSVEVVDPETWRRAGAGRVGEVWVAGGGVASGYWRRPEESRAAFAAALAGGSGERYLRTGDLGFLRGGELYLCGRLKDLIVLRGRNLHPQEIETASAGSSADLAPHAVAAFSIEDAAGERLVVAQEVRPRLRPDAATIGDLAAGIRTAVAAAIEAQVHDVVLLPAGALPVTSSGKVQRRACRQLYLEDRLPLLGRSRLGAAPAASTAPSAAAAPSVSRAATRSTAPATSAGSAAPTTSTISATSTPSPAPKPSTAAAAPMAADPAAVASAKVRVVGDGVDTATDPDITTIPYAASSAVLGEEDRGASLPAVEAVVRALAARVLRVAPQALADDRPLLELGLDSLAAMELAHAVEAELGAVIELPALLAGAGVAELARRIVAGPAGEARAANLVGEVPATARPAGQIPADALLAEEESAKLARRTVALPTGELPAEALLAGVGDAERLVSHNEHALWLLDRLAPRSTAYHLPSISRLHGPVSAAALRAAFQALVDRHEALRTGFPREGGEPVRRVVPRVEAPFAVHEAAAWSAAELAARVEDEALRPFDVERGPLVRTALFRTGGEPLLVVVFHHLVADFWSLSVLARELAALLAPSASGHHEVLNAGPGQSAGGLLAASIDSPRRPPRFSSYLSDGAEDTVEPLLPPLVAGSFVLGGRRLPEAPALPVSRAVRSRAAKLAGAPGERLWAYWREQLAALPPALDLPVDRPGLPLSGETDAAGRRGGAVRWTLRREVGPAVRQAARERGATLYTALLAAFEILLSRLTGETDVVVSSPVAGRSAGPPGVGECVGYLTNLVLLRGDLSGAPTFAALVERTRRRVVGALDHQEMPLPRLVELLRAETPDEAAPLPRAMIVLHRPPAGFEGLARIAFGDGGGRLQLGGLALESLAPPAADAQVDLKLTIGDLGEELALALDFRTALFDRTTIERWAAAFETLLAAAAARPETPIGDLPWLSAAERHQAFHEANDRPFGAASDERLHQPFERQADARPEAVALIDGTVRVSYRELEERANRLAHHLRAAGAGAERFVGVCLERSAEVVVALLAVLKSGAAYLPLDPAHPPERLALLLADAGAERVVSRASLLPALGAAAERAVCVDRDAAAIALRPSRRPAPLSGRRNLAYAIYTSGSTGQPKGVGIEHGSALALVAWAAEAFGPAELSGMLASTALTFDLSVFELFAPLAHGGTVVLAENVLALADLPARGAVRLVNTVPSALAGALELAPLPAGVRTVVLAGEPLRRSLAARLHAAGIARVWNLYGPSEDTTYSTGTVVAPGGAEPTIGRPVAGSRAYVVDAEQRLTPLGVSGELCLGGAGVARGYLGRPGQTAERFVPDPFAAGLGVPGARMYRTGDRAALLPGGDLDYRGRLDRQVKVRGFRIEPGEIEVALLGVLHVREAAVEVRDGALVAWAVVAAGAPDAPAAALRAALARRLPPALVPSWVTIVAALPRTAHGKVDRHRLPSPPRRAASQGEAPRGPVEELLARIWSDLLNVERVDREASFFELGGHSLQAARVVARVRETLGVELPIGALFEERRLRDLALRLERTGAASAPAVEPAPRGRPLPLSLAQERIWFLERLETGRSVYGMPLALRLRGPLDLAFLAAALAALAGRHEALRTTIAVIDEEPRQRIAAAEPAAALPEIDLAALGGGGGGGGGGGAVAEARRLARREARRPFDLARGPLLRSALVRLAADDHLLLLTLHHIVGDLWSLGILLRELGELYAARQAGREPALPPLPVQAADHAVWERGPGAVPEEEVAAWAERLRGVPPLELPADRPRPAEQSARGATLRLRYPAELAASLDALARRHGATLFMTLLAGFEVLLARTAGQCDFAVGTAMAERDRPELEGVVGCFVNTLALRADLTPEPASFAVLLARVRATALAAYAHRRVPFERLVSALAPQRDRSRPPIVQTLLVLQNVVLAEPRMPGLAAEVWPTEPGGAQLELSVLLRRSGATGGSGGNGGDGGDGGNGGDCIEAAFEYAADVFDGPSIGRFARHLETVLAAAARAPQAPLDELSLLSPAERHQLLVEWSGVAAPAAPATGAPSPAWAPSAGWAAPEDDRPIDLVRRIEGHAARAPEAAAVIVAGVAGTVVTYRDLLGRSGRLARWLAARGVGPETVVGIAAHRSVETIAAVLGVLQAGGAYLALDPAEPEERLLQILGAARPLVVLGARPPGGWAGLTWEELERETAESPASLATAPAAPNAPAAPSALTDSAGPTAPGGPAWPTGPSVLTAPAGPTVPAASAGPTALTRPTALTGRAAPNAPVVPNESTEPTALVVPAGPSGPGAPTGRTRPPAPAEVDGNHPAYVVFTSGSTGRPKGVVVCRAALSRYAAEAGSAFALGPGDRLLQFASLRFDASAEEIFCTLARGAALVLRSDAMAASIAELLAACGRLGVTVLDLPTAYWQELAARLDEDGLALPAEVRLVVIGGEALLPAALAAWRLRVGAGVRLLNTYGPTEATIVATIGDLGAPSRPWETPIGRPVFGATAYVAGGDLQPVPIGAAGELLLGGSRLARGYLDLPERTAESFVPDPWSSQAGSRLYCTGDRVRALADGRLQFLGRVDGQVKVRGVRIEPAEIEAALGAHPGVRVAAVVLRRDGADAGLVAYVVAPGVESVDLRAFLRRRLPEVMVPARYVALADLPVAASGKVDRRRLPAPPAEAPPRQRAPTQPLDPIEEIVAGIWCEVLGREEVGQADDFFALGGHSLLATRVVARLTRSFAVELPLVSLFAEPTVAGLARIVRGALGGALALAPAPPPPRAAADAAGVVTAPLTFSQERLWFLDRLRAGSAFYNLGGAVRLRGTLSVPALAASLDLAVRRHGALRTSFRDGTAGEPVQVVAPALHRPLPVVDLAALGGAAREREVVRLATEEARRPFDLERGALWSATVYRLAGREHGLVLSLHHIIADGWALALLTDELIASYGEIAAGRIPAPPPAPQLADFALAQRARLSGERLASDLDFWRGRLAGLPSLDLPLDRPRPPAGSFRGAVLPVAVPQEVVAPLRLLGRRHGATLFMALLAGFLALLHRLSGQTDVAVGTDVAGRSRVETEGLLGFLVNSLVLRADLSGNPRFVDLVERTRAVALAAYAHQEAPFHQVVQAVRPQRDAGRNPLFQVMFILQNAPPPGAAHAAADGLAVSAIDVDPGTAVFDWSLSLEESADGGLLGAFRYNTDLFARRTAEATIARYGALLAGAAASPETRLDALPTESAGTREQRTMDTRKRKDLRFEKLASAQPKAVTLSREDLVRTGDPGLPLVVEPAREGVDPVAWAADQKERIRGWLGAHGGVLCRGFDLPTLARFQAFVAAASADPIRYGERSSPRSVIEGEVYTSTDHPADQPIVLHNEQSYTLSWPMRIAFFCVEPATTGGRTPIADSRRIHDRLPAAMRDAFARRQVLYVRNYGDGLGLSWREAFQTSERSEVERYCRSAGIEVEWKGEERLRTRQVRPAIRLHPHTGEPVWFNHAIFFHVSSLPAEARRALESGLAPDELPAQTFYGDGGAIEEATLAAIRAAFAAETVSFPWRKGDVLLLDNMLVAHGREPFTGPRRIAVAMAEPWAAPAPAAARAETD